MLTIGNTVLVVVTALIGGFAIGYSLSPKKHSTHLMYGWRGGEIMPPGYWEGKADRAEVYWYLDGKEVKHEIFEGE